MKTLILAITLIACAAVRAEPWTIDDKTREECAKAGGCILTIPDGLLIPVEEVNKIGEGWLNFGKGSSSGWMFSPGVVQKGIQVAADAARRTGVTAKSP